MSIRIDSIQNTSNDEWDKIWSECDFATFFHSRQWANLWNIYSKGFIKQGPKTVIFSDGKRAVLPLSFEEGYRGIVKTYLSSPASTFGGWISLDELTDEHGSILESYLKNLGDVIWRLNPYEKYQSDLKLPKALSDQTACINLSLGMDKIVNDWSKGHWSAVTKAKREGVDARVAHTKDDFLTYYRIYEDTLKRWGNRASSKYSFDLFEEIFKMQSKNIKLWLAFYKEQAVTGALCFYSKRHVVYWHGASLESYFNLRPVNLLVYEAIHNACQGGYKWFDFNPSGEHEGVKAFKKSFGAKFYSASIFSKRSFKSRFIGVLLKCFQSVKE